jgi:hypothetical protein
MRDRIIGLKAVPVSKLRGFSAGNPKTHTDADRALLEASIENHGYVLPVAAREVGDGTYELIDGHHRVEVIAAKGGDQKIKVVVLDVDTVADGRRIILALKHTADWDMSKLEEYVRETMADGVSAAQIMADTGLTGSDLDALATAGQDFLDGIPPPEDEGKPINEGVSKAGLTAEHVQFAVPLTRDQSQTVHKAIKLAKQLTERKVSGDALEAICAFYLNNVQQKEE